MKAFSLKQAVTATAGTYYGPESALEERITFVTSDSREAAPGALFAAFRGARADGHAFMADCLQRGAVCCLSEREPAENERPCIVVPSVLRAMGALAAWYRGGFDIPVIGVTGSVGKTTTKEMLWAVLKQRYRTHKTMLNFNNELGVPKTVLNMPDDAEAAVIEMGISSFGEMTRLTNIVHPTIAVFSVIGDAHLEFLHDRSGVLKAKTEIFGSMQEDDLAIMNGDDPYQLGFKAPCKRITYGIGAENDFYADEIENTGLGGTACTIHHNGKSFRAVIPAFGRHIVYTALAGAAAGWALGLTDEEIAAGLASFETVGNRARLIDTGKLRIISDCYNANPSSMASSIESLCTLQGRKMSILGDMLELGENTVQMHYEVGRKAALSGVSLVIACGTLAENIAKGATENGAETIWFASKAQLLEQLGNLVREGDNILIKASHSMAFEEIAEKLQKL